MKQLCCVLLLVFAVSACGSSDTAPTPPASLNATGTLTVQGCQTLSVTGLFSCTLFTGLITNSGTGCAANVRGTTVTTNTSNMQIGEQGWTYTNTVRPGEQFAYNGGPITVGQSGTWTYRTTASFDNIRCP